MLADLPSKHCVQTQATEPLKQETSQDLLPDTTLLNWIAQDVMPHENAVRLWLNKTNLPGVSPDDIIQECYARFCAASYQNIQNGRAFFFACAKNLVFEYARRAKISYLKTDLGLEACNVVDQRPDP